MEINAKAKHKVFIDIELIDFIPLLFKKLFLFSPSPWEFIRGYSLVPHDAGASQTAFPRSAWERGKFGLLARPKYIRNQRVGCLL